MWEFCFYLLIKTKRKNENIVEFAHFSFSFRLMSKNILIFLKTKNRFV